jgi:hypothetical protein
MQQDLPAWRESQWTLFQQQGSLPSNYLVRSRVAPLLDILHHQQTVLPNRKRVLISPSKPIQTCEYVSILLCTPWHSFSAKGIRVRL